VIAEKGRMTKKFAAQNETDLEIKSVALKWINLKHLPGVS
jgi:hypothetical protein